MSVAAGTDKPQRQYLARHAEPEAEAADLAEIGPYEFCLVIPARRENWSRIAAALANLARPFLLILVVNAPGPEPSTIQLLVDARRHGKKVAGSRNIEYLHTPFAFDVLLVDRCSEGRTIPRRQGVGLARKIGADIATRLMMQGRVAPGFIYCTDADVALPADYFQAGPWPPEVAALLYPFVHIDTSGAVEAALLYEISMLYYAAGLGYAGSPYAFPALGSAMAVSMRHYTRVRGFPRRNAAEDFYLLNKLAKSGRMHQLRGPVIDVAARLSNRVPLGTGVGIARISELAHPLQDYGFYNPGIFTLLKQWLSILDDAWQSPRVSQRVATAGEIQAWIQGQDMDTVIARALQRCKTRDVFDKTMRDWFDGLRTLKFIHFMRDNFLPSVPIASLRDARFLHLPPNDPVEPGAVRVQLAARVFQRHRKTD